MPSMYDVEKDTFHGISEEMDKRACTAADITWQAIAPDLLVDDRGRYDESKSMRRSEVIEIVRDANHMETYGEDFDAARYLIWVSRFHKTHYKELIKRIFPFKWYGS